MYYHFSVSLCSSSRIRKIIILWQAKKIFISYSENPDSAIFAGDFNSTLSLLDRSSQNSLKKGDVDFKKFLNICNLNDVWRFHYKSEQGFTYYDKKNMSYSRLDYILATKDITDIVKEISVTQPVKNSNVCDHNAARAVLSLNKPTKGPGYWKLNNSILQDISYVSTISEIIENANKDFESLKSHQLVWEMLKVRIKEFSIKFCQMRAKNDKMVTKENQEKLDNLNKK